MEAIKSYYRSTLNAVERTVKFNNPNDYRIGFGSALLINALKIGSLNLFAFPIAFATYHRANTLIGTTVQNTPLNSSIAKAVSVVFAAAVYTGVSSLSLPATFAVFAGMVLTENYIRWNLRHTPLQH